MEIPSQLMQHLISLLKSSSHDGLILLILTYKAVLACLMARVHIQPRTRYTGTGSTHSRWDTNEAIIFIKDVFTRYLNVAKLHESDIIGKKILEIGPGDNLCVALSFISAGAKSVTCIDRFYSKRDVRQQLAIYSAFRETLNAERKVLFDSACKIQAKRVIINERLLKYVHGVSFEDFSRNTSERFDLIVSNAVLEHLYDLPKAINAMYDLLVPGGMIVHVVDLTDHKMFSPKAPLFFLTVPQRLWRVIGRESDCPNRHRLSDYISICKKCGFVGIVYVVVTEFDRDAVAAFCKRYGLPVVARWRASSFRLAARKPA
ncbi:MAG: class I SAM-dependent methyltransferase [Candidatus Sigynarchaeota archaeon]